MNYNTPFDIPVGFGMALAMNSAAMKAFSSLPESGQRQYIERASFAKSREDMDALVRSLVEYNPDSSPKG